MCVGACVCVWVGCTGDMADEQDDEDVSGLYDAPTFYHYFEIVSRGLEKCARCSQQGTKASDNRNATHRDHTEFSLWICVFD